MRITIIATGFEDDSPNLLSTQKKAAEKGRSGQDVHAELPFNQLSSPVKQETAEQTGGYSKEYELLLDMLKGS